MEKKRKLAEIIDTNIRNLLINNGVSLERLIVNAKRICNENNKYNEKKEIKKK